MNSDDFTAFGKTRTLAEWSQATGLSVRTLKQRIEHTNWTPERILTAPRFTRVTKSSKALIDSVTPYEEDERAQYVVAAHPDGLTLEQLGALFNVTRERIRQIEEIAYGKLRRNPEARHVLKALLEQSVEMEMHRDESRSREAWSSSVDVVQSKHEEGPGMTFKGREVTSEDGHTCTIANHAKRLKLSRSAIEMRIKNGWTETEACTYGKGQRPPRLGDWRAKVQRNGHDRGPDPVTELVPDPDDEVELAPPAERFRSVPASTALTLRHDARERIKHRFPLRPNMVVELELPADLRASEAVRIARFVEAMSFTEEETP